MQFFFFDGATARSGPWPPLHYATKSLDPLLCLSIRLIPSFSGPWTRHPAISFFGLPLRLVAYSFPYLFFWDCGVLHSFHMNKPSYSLAFNKPDHVLPLNYGFSFIVSSNTEHVLQDKIRVRRLQCCVRMYFARWWVKRFLACFVQVQHRYKVVDAVYLYGI